VQRVTLTAAIMLGLSSAAPARAQDASDSAAYRALTQTPLAALANPLGVSILGPEIGRWDLHARYGIMSIGDGDEYVHSFGIGGDVKLGDGRIGLTVGAWLPDCDEADCPGHFMAELSFGERLLQAALGRPSGTASLNVGIDAGAAIGTPDDATLFASSASLPISLVTASSGLRLVPYLAPGLGTGLVRPDGQETEAGLRAMFSAGVGVVGLGGGISANAGVQRVFMRDGNWLASVGISYAGAP
jgi:hypothetical protein